MPEVMGNILESKMTSKQTCTNCGTDFVIAECSWGMKMSANNPNTSPKSAVNFPNSFNFDEQFFTVQNGRILSLVRVALDKEIEKRPFRRLLQFWLYYWLYGAENQRVTFRNFYSNLMKNNNIKFVLKYSDGRPHIPYEIDDVFGTDTNDAFLRQVTMGQYAQEKINLEHSTRKKLRIIQTAACVSDPGFSKHFWKIADSGTEPPITRFSELFRKDAD